ncbi:hypothetical protein Tco_0186414 [Tanacetum coccineum]
MLSIILCYDSLLESGLFRLIHLNEPAGCFFKLNFERSSSLFTTFPIPLSDNDDNSTFLLEFESFHVDYPDSGDSTIDVVEDIPVDVPKTFCPPSQHSHGFRLHSFLKCYSDRSDVSFPSGDRNKIYDPGICIKVESMRFLAPLSPVIDTLLPFSSENKDKVFTHGVLASKNKSPHSSLHRGFYKSFQAFFS